jgi:ABC-type nitrate/sulfonate/bicarbonate transport system permease component
VGTDVTAPGLGTLILQFNNQGSTAEMFAVIAVLAVIGVALFLLVALIQRIALPWYVASRERERP